MLLSIVICVCARARVCVCVCVCVCVRALMCVEGSVLSGQFHCRHRTEHVIDLSLFSNFLSCMDLNEIHSNPVITTSV